MYKYVNKYNYSKFLKYLLQIKLLSVFKFFEKVKTRGVPGLTGGLRRRQPVTPEGGVVCGLVGTYSSIVGTYSSTGSRKNCTTYSKEASLYTVGLT